MRSFSHQVFTVARAYESKRAIPVFMMARSNGHSNKRTDYATTLNYGLQTRRSKCQVIPDFSKNPDPRRQNEVRVIRELRTQHVVCRSAVLTRPVEVGEVDGADWITRSANAARLFEQAAVAREHAGCEVGIGAGR